MAKFKIRIVNPGKKADMGRNKKGQFTKGGGSRRRRRRKNPAALAPVSNPSPRRRRRRSSSSSSSAPRRRRRRRNPEGGGSGGGFNPLKSYDFKDLIPYLGSQLAQAGVVKQWGDNYGTSMISGQHMPISAYRGQSWTLKNYLIATAVGYLGAKAIARSGMFGGSRGAAIWWRSAVEQMATRMIWTEGIARWEWGQAHFGSPAMPASGSPGEVYDDGSGNRWVRSQNGQWVSMQGLGGGYMGELVQAGPLGYGELVKAGPLGNPGYMGELVKAGPLGRHTDNSGYTPIGHLLSESTSDRRNEQAQQLGLGSRDPYAAVMFAA